MNVHLCKHAGHWKDEESASYTTRSTLALDGACDYFAGKSWRLGYLLARRRSAKQFQAKNLFNIESPTRESFNSHSKRINHIYNQ